MGAKDRLHLVALAVTLLISLVLVAGCSYDYTEPGHPPTSGTAPMEEVPAAGQYTGTAACVGETGAKVSVGQEHPGAPFQPLELALDCAWGTSGVIGLERGYVFAHLVLHGPGDTPWTGGQLAGSCDRRQLTSLDCPAPPVLRVVGWANSWHPSPQLMKADGNVPLLTPACPQGTR